MTFSKEQISAFFKAIREGDLDTVKDFLNQGVDVNTWYSTSTGNSVLHMACEKGHVLLVRLLLQAHANPNKLNFSRSTPLHLAVANSSAPVVQLLLHAKADLDVRDLEGRTPLYWAVFTKNRQITYDLVQAGAAVDICNRYEISPLSWVARDEKKYFLLQILLQTKQNLNKAPVCRNPLFLASKQGHAYLVEQLLKRGVNPNMVGRNKQTALLAAAENGHAEVVSLLLKAGAYLEATNLKEQTPLLLACKNGHLETAKVLLAAHADRNTLDEEGNSPQTYIEQNNWQDLA